MGDQEKCEKPVQHKVHLCKTELGGGSPAVFADDTDGIELVLCNEFPYPLQIALGPLFCRNEGELFQEILGIRMMLR